MVEVRARASGYLTKVAVSEGVDVKAGDLLIEIDPRPYEIEVSAAKAKLVKVEALAKHTAAELARVKAVVEKGAEPDSTLREVQARADAGRADVDLAVAGVKAAELRLSYTRVRAPRGGRVSRVLLDAGNLVKADTTPIMTVVSIDTLYVAFEVAERNVAKIKAEKGAGPPVMIGLAGEDGFPHAGRIVLVEPVVDPKASTVRVRTLLPNPKGEFRPGAFVRVRLTASDK